MKAIMIEFSVSAGIPQLKLGIVPTHKVNVAAGTDIYTFWYVQDPISSRAFDSQKDRDLVELMYAKGIRLGMNEFESFAIGADRNYHLLN